MLRLNKSLRLLEKSLRRLEGNIKKHEKMSENSILDRSDDELISILMLSRKLKREDAS